MSLRPLRFLVMDNPPSVFSNCLKFPAYDQTVNCIYPGWVMEITKILADSINTTLDTKLADEAIIKAGTGGKVGSKWTGLMGEVQRNTTDTVANFYQYTSTRAQDFEFSYPVWNMQIMFVVRANTRNLRNQILNSFEPFTVTIWMLILAALILSSIQGAVIRFFEAKLKLITKKHVLEKFWQYSRTYLYQFDDKETFILHSGMLLSSLLNSIDTSPFDTTDQMIAQLANHQLKLVTFTEQYETLWFFDVLQTSNETFYKSIRDALIGNPIVIKDTVEDALHEVSQGGHVLMTQEDYDGILDIQKTCNLILFKQGLPTQSAYYIFPKNSSFVELWNRAITMNSDFIRHTYNRYFGPNVKLVIPPICSTSRYVVEASKPIDLLAFCGTFLIYLLGVVCGSVAVVTECIFDKWKRYIKSNPDFVLISMKNSLLSKIRRWLLRFHSHKQA